MSIRCWETTDPLYLAYHDEEWGRPVTTSGASTSASVSRASSRVSPGSRSCASGRRSAPRSRGSTRTALPRFGERDVERLLGDASIVRHRGKIEATIANARATVALREADAADELFWSHRPRRTRRPRSLADWPPRRRSRRRSRRPAARGLPLCRPDDRLRGHAGLRRRQRPRRGAAGCGTPSRPRRGIRPDPSARLWVSAERRWSGVGDFKYGQWRYQLVEACPRDLTGIV